MDSSSPSPSPPTNPNPFVAAASFLSHHLSRLGLELSARVDHGRRLALAAAFPRPSLPPFAATSVGTAPAAAQGKHAFDLALSPDYVAKTLAGTAVYTVSNSNNEFVLVSDPNNGMRSLGILCFRPEDAQTLLAQVQVRLPILGKGARVVPITLDQVYMLKVEGIAFRFLPDPLQIRNALAFHEILWEMYKFDAYMMPTPNSYVRLSLNLYNKLKSSDVSKSFDGVPVFQSDLLVVKKKNKRYYPIYFQKEDLERELLKVSRASRGSGSSQNIMVGSLEDVLRKMEMNAKDSGWDDMIFIPPGKSYAEHIKAVSA